MEGFGISSDSIPTLIRGPHLGGLPSRQTFPSRPAVKSTKEAEATIYESELLGLSALCGWRLRCTKTGIYVVESGYVITPLCSTYKLCEGLLLLHSTHGRLGLDIGTSLTGLVNLCLPFDCVLLAQERMAQ